LRLVAKQFHEVIAAFEAVLERKTFHFPNRQRYGRLQLI
jgi:hypothetical protein